MIKAVIFDLDGTLYLGKTPIAGAAEAVERFRKQGKRIFFITNAATKSREGIAAKLSAMGFQARKDEIISGAYLLARHIRQNHSGKKVYFVGERGMYDEFAALGIQTADEADVVAAGLDRAFTYDKLAKAHMNLRKGAAFLASSLDHVYPTETGDMPGSGSIVEAIAFCSGKRPYVVGKPNTFAFEIMKKDYGLKAEEVLMVGDRLDTDITFAKACGLRSALVLSGNAKKKDIGKGIVPDQVVETVAELTLP